MKNTKTWLLLLVVFSVLTLAVQVAHSAPLIEAEPELQAVMGDLYTITAAVQLFYDDTHKKKIPSLDELAHYLNSPLPLTWAEDFRAVDLNGVWWVGRRVPEFSKGRKFLRANAEKLEVYDNVSGNFWMGESFAWLKAGSLDTKAKPGTFKGVTLRVVQGSDKKAPALFFNTPETDYYWWSKLRYTTSAHSVLLQKFGQANQGKQAKLFVIPPPPTAAQEKFKASPVGLPEQFTVNKDDDEMSIDAGAIRINPIPKNND